MSKMAIEKNRRFVIFRTPFYRFWSLLGSIGIYRKTGPTKSTVLGPGPPPGKIYKIYRNYGFFTILGPSIEPEKPSVKSASTANPPQKVTFIGFFIISRPNLADEPFFIKNINYTIGLKINLYWTVGIIYSPFFGIGIDGAL
jgi:hypothetical protein